MFRYEEIKNPEFYQENVLLPIRIILLIEMPQKKSWEKAPCEKV